MRIYTTLQKKLASLAWVNGRTADTELDNLAIAGLTFVFSTVGTAEATVAQILAAIKRIIVSINGYEDFVIDGRRLYDLNRIMRGGIDPTFRQVAAQERSYLYLTLPFELFHARNGSDTLLDLRPRGGQTPQAFVALELAQSANVGASSLVEIREWYYPLGAKARKSPLRTYRTMFDIAYVANGGFNFDFEYNTANRNILDLMFRLKDASGDSEPINELSSLRLTANTAGGQEVIIFDLTGDDLYAMSGSPARGGVYTASPGGGVNDVLDTVVYDFTKAGLFDRDNRSTHGFLDVAGLTSLQLSGQTATAAAGNLEVAAHFCNYANPYIAGPPPSAAEVAARSSMAA